jgi:hypothetical protein
MEIEFENFDIVSIVEKNPLTKLNNDEYSKSKTICKLVEKFTSKNQQFFVANFYGFLNYNTKIDYVIRLDKVWKWLGFSRIDVAKAILVKTDNDFVEGCDYIIEKATPGNSGGKFDEKNEINFPPEYSGGKFVEKNETRGGSNKEEIRMTIRCFKRLCLKSNTEKAKEIREYYLDLEEIMNELVEEEAIELKEKLQITNLMIESKNRIIMDCQQKMIETEKETRRKIFENAKKAEEALIASSRNKHLVYMILVENFIIKYGHAKDIKERMEDHRTEFGHDIVLLRVFETNFNRELERMITKNPEISENIFTKTYKNPQTELIRLDDVLTEKKLFKIVDKLYATIKEEIVIHLQNELNELKREHELNETNSKLELYKLKEKYENEIKLLKDKTDTNQFEKSELKVNKTVLGPKQDSVKIFKIKTHKERELNNINDPKIIRTLFKLSKDPDHRIDSSTIWKICKENGVKTDTMRKINKYIEDMGCIQYKSSNKKGFKNIVLNTDHVIKTEAQIDIDTIKRFFKFSQTKKKRLCFENILEICKDNGVKTTDKNVIFSVLESMGCVKYTWKNSEINGGFHNIIRKDILEDINNDFLEEQRALIEEQKKNQAYMINQRERLRNKTLEKLKKVGELFIGTSDVNDKLESCYIFELCRKNGINVGMNKIGPYLESLGCKKYQVHSGKRGYTNIKEI